MRLPSLAALAAALAALPCPGQEFDPARLPSRQDMPDPLVMLDGTRVTTADDWHARRKPELKRLFQDVMYGRYPAVKPAVAGTVAHEDKHALGGKATLREVALSVGVAGAPPVYVLVVTPNGRPGPCPAFVGLNFAGNHALTADPKVRIPDGWMAAKRPGVKDNRATDAGRGGQADTWPLETIVGRGYALATAFYGDVIPDKPGLRGGLSDVLMPADAGENGTGAVLGWAWVIHRVVDYLATLPEVDGKRIASVGHSRLGKTALVAAAFDDRIALAVPSQAGCGGTAPSRTRNPKAETVKRINTAFPHWFGGTFKRFDEAVDRLPVDQNCLVALCAPRPVLFTAAADDQWADPPGQFEVLKAAAPVYKLLGADGLGADAPPAVGTLVDSRLGYWVRPGKHAMTRADWETYLAFADKWLR